MVFSLPIAEFYYVYVFVSVNIGVQVILCEQLLSPLPQTIDSLTHYLHFFSSQFGGVSENKEHEKEVKKEKKESKEEVKQEETKDGGETLRSIRQQFDSYDANHQDSFASGVQKDHNREFACKHGFVSSKFKPSLGDKRAETLADYILDQSFQAEIGSFEIIWLHKYSVIAESKNDLEENSLVRKTDSETVLTRSQPSETLRMTHKSLSSTLQTSSTPLSVEISQILSENPHFCLSLKSLFLGTQSWKPPLSSESTQKVEITKFDLQNLHIFTSSENEKVTLISSEENDRFLEFYLWSKKYAYSTH